MKKRFLLVAFLASIASAQTAPPAEVKPAEKIVLKTSPEKDALFLALIARDQVDKEIAAFNAKIQKLQADAQQEAQQLQAKEKAAQEGVDKADAVALKSLNLDLLKYTIDHEAMSAQLKQDPKAVEAKKEK